MARELRIRRRRIARRLRVRQWLPQNQPMFSGGNIHYQLSRRDRGQACGGIGLLQQLVWQVGLAGAIDESLHVRKEHRPSAESDHVLNIAYNLLAGGECLQDLEWLRNDEVYLEALGTNRIPNPIPARREDFCRRFTAADVRALLDTINQVRLKVWEQQPPEFFAQAILDADLNAFIRQLCPIVKTARRRVFRLPDYNPWQEVFLRGFWAVHRPLLE